MKVREAAVAKREADLTRQEAATLSGNADAMKREGELAAREQALGSQLADIKAAEAQLQEKKLEAKELQVSPDGTPLGVDVVDGLLLCAYLLCAPQFAVTGRCQNTRGAAVWAFWQPKSCRQPSCLCPDRQNVHYEACMA